MRSSPWPVLLPAVLAVLLPAACQAPGLVPQPETAEGEGEGSEGEGEDAPIAVDITRLHVVNGALEESPLELGGAVPVAGGSFAGGPALIAVEVVDGRQTGALLVFKDPLAGEPPVRIADALEAGGTRVTGEAAFGDLDGDGDSDVVVHLQPAFRRLILLDEAGAPHLVDTRFEGFHGAMAPFDVDEDGAPDVVLTGGNGDMVVLRVEDDQPVASVRNARHRVGDYGYCIESFLTVGAGLFGVGDVCAAFDVNLPAPPSGPDRLFALDASLTATASVDLGADGTSGVFAHRDQIAVIIGGTSTLLVAPPLPAAVTTFAAQPALGSADLDGGGEPTLLLAPRTGATPPPGAMVIAGLDLERLPAPVVLDLDGDGADDVVVVRPAGP